MIPPPSISVVIPTFNMLVDLKRLTKSIIESGLINICQEIIIVDDGSTDETKSWASTLVNLPQYQGKLIYIDSIINEGRYLCRLKGARASRYTHLLFLDSRTELELNFDSSICDLVKNFEVIQGTVKIPRNESIYNLYWDCSHKYLFSQHYTDQVKGFWLNTDNFENYTCGTGIFYCNKNIFLEATNQFKHPPLSDDRALIKEICKIQRIWTTQNLQTLWRPRQDLKSFLLRIWERGPSFVSYHFYRPDSKMRMPIYFGLVIILANIILLFFDVRMWLISFLVQILAIGMSLVIFTQKPFEIIKLFWLHIAVVLIFGLGIIKGLWTERGKN
jgi:glycosyltransferase involved in cell wall biosynthesis